MGHLNKLCANQLNAHRLPGVGVLNERAMRAGEIEMRRGRIAPLAKTSRDNDSAAPGYFLSLSRTALVSAEAAADKRVMADS